MHRQLLTTIALLTLALVVPLASMGLASTPRNFVAPMSPDQEVADEPVVSNATGVATFKLSRDGAELSYRLIVANIENVTQAHIHLGSRGVNGPVVVWLYPDAPPAQLIAGRTNGVLATGVISDASLVGPLAGATLADLVAHITAGNAYVNVHTSQFPPGEIRGQIDVPRGG